MTPHPSTNPMKKLIRAIIQSRARANGNSHHIIALLKFDLTDEEILILLRAVYATPICKTYNPAIGFCREHVRLCNNYRAIHQEFTETQSKMTFDEANDRLLSYTDKEMLPLIRKYAR